MHRLLLRSSLPLLFAISTAVTGAALAQSQASETDLKARCSQLVSYYDRYGASRSENSDGARNTTRIAAEIDCKNGHYAEGVAAMEALLEAKNFGLPAPSTGLAQQPPANGAPPPHRLQQWR